MKIKKGGFERKIKSRQALQRVVQLCRRQGKTVVFTNGCFDLLHAGHVTYLQKAKQFGDVLVVGLNSDASVRQIKGPHRPLNSEKDRLRVLAALEAVDYVSVFSEGTPLRLIQELHPDILVKGADWKKDQIAGAKEVESWGGRVERIKLVPGRSTTTVINVIARRHSKTRPKQSQNSRLLRRPSASSQ